MMLITPAMRLCIALVLLTVNLLFVANFIGLIPDVSKSKLELRKVLSESLALQFCAAAEKGSVQIIQNTLRAVVERNEDIRSAAIRTHEGKLIALAGEHLAHWKAPVDGKSTPNQVQTPVYRQGEKWATVELRFAPIWMDSLASGFTDSFVGLLVFVGLSSFVSYLFLIKRTLRELDPSAVIPDRVQNAFNVLQEGVLILDDKEQILMANKAFAKLFDRSPETLIGLKGSELGWMDCQTPEQIGKLPWLGLLREGKDRKDTLLSLMNRAGSKIKLAVNASMVADGQGNCRGCLVTFDDITQLEEKNFELNDLVTRLRLSHEEIQAKSNELEFLASRDPLTLCLNRRSLEKNLDELFSSSKAEGTDLSCLMVDIDFFKSVNDRFGHATGDRVIKAVADVLKGGTRENDLVGRYGGEEFCVVLPDLGLEGAVQIAERMRKTIEKMQCGGVNVTVSLGVSSLELNANKPDALVNQADKALYLAKTGGRNRVATWGGNETHTLSSKQSTGSSSQRDESGKRTSPSKWKQRVQELEALLEKRKLEFEHHEMYDPQTGLPTRPLFEDRISHEIGRSKRREALLAVLSMTIDTIKRVDETLGHRSASQLVKACGNRLNNVLRKDNDTVAMIEGLDRVVSVSQINQTQFGILLTDIKQVDDVTWVIKRLVDAFNKPFQVNDQEIYASAYIGVSIFPHDGSTVEKLYNSAVNACNHAKERTGNHRYLFASRDINDKAIRQLQVESGLHEAIDKNELQLHFQPQVEAATGRVSRFEALLRWKSNRLGAVPPDEFIPVAEQSGLIYRIGDWVLQQACKQIRDWLDAGFEIESVAVNLSGLQLRQRNLAHRIQEILGSFNIDPNLLEIELTESSLAKAYDKSYAVLGQIRELGVRVSMDDFGTGYSSLAYLKDIPLSCIKTDRSFTVEIGKDESAEKLIASIVSMAHGLGLEVVAEGVEERHQADFLKALGCEYLQGYFFGSPAPPAEASDHLNAKRAA